MWHETIILWRIKRLGQQLDLSIVVISTMIALSFLKRVIQFIWAIDFSDIIKYNITISVSIELKRVRIASMEIGSIIKKLFGVKIINLIYMNE